MYRCAGLDVELAHGRPVVHGVEGSHLVDAHRGHLENACHLVHDADAGEAVLPLAQVEQRHDGGLLVLGRVALEDLGDDGLILLGELEGDVRVVVGRVAMLCGGFPVNYLMLNSQAGRRRNSPPSACRSVSSQRKRMRGSGGTVAVLPGSPTGRRSA